jgi:hypothetical protein
VGIYYDASDTAHGFIVIVPKPSTLALLGIGAISPAVYVWRRAKQRVPTGELPQGFR